MAKAKQAEAEAVEEKNEMTLDQAIKTVETPGIHVRRPQPGSIAERQLFHFASQEKVRYRFPRSAGEKADAFETVCVNDLLITIQKGVTVSIPEDIAKILDDMQNITDNALRKDALKDLPSDSPLSQ